MCARPQNVPSRAVTVIGLLVCVGIWMAGAPRSAVAARVSGPRPAGAAVVNHSMPPAPDAAPATVATMPLSACTSASVTTAPATTASVGQTIAVNVTSSGCANPRYQYLVAPPGGGFAVVQPYTSSAGIQWATTGLAPGVYIIDVWARDAASTGFYDTYAFVNFTLTTNCISVSMSTTPAGTAAPGASVTITATAVTGCPNPQYAYFVAPPGGGFTLLQNWTTNSSILWATNGLATGAYTLVIWARDAASASPYYDTYTSLNFTLGTNCTAATITATPAGQAQIGTTVALSATASGCPNPQFQYLALPPGGTWQIVRSYAASANASWNTTGLAAGSYLLDIWVRDASSGAFYDAFAVTTINVTTWTPCNSGTITVAPGLNVAVGTQMTLTAMSVFGCASPVYQFLVLPPGGTWQLLRAYGAINFIPWDTTGLAPGTYVVDIWAKDANSTAFYDTFVAATVTLH